MTRYPTLLILACCCITLAMSTGCRRGQGPNGNGGNGDIDDLQFGRPGLDGELGAGGREFGPDRRVTGVEFDAALFDYDSAQITSSQGQKIVTVADYLNRNARVTLIVEGHCDERGSREYNLALGERRALAARAYLIGLGIGAQRIHTRSLGEESPADPGHNDQAWRQNRRAEFLLYQ